MAGAYPVGVTDTEREEDSNRAKVYVQQMSTTLATRNVRMQDTLTYCETIPGQVRSVSGQMTVAISSNLATRALSTSIFHLSSIHRCTKQTGQHG